MINTVMGLNTEPTCTALTGVVLQYQRPLHIRSVKLLFDRGNLDSTEILLKWVIALPGEARGRVTAG
jgi:hypothetical protein